MNITELIQQLNATDENHQIEAKRGSAVDKSFFESVCAFSNEPGLGGGYILLGLVKKEGALFPTYEIVGVDNPDKIASDISSGCGSKFSSKVRATVETAIVKGKKVIGVFVPEIQASEKPVYFKEKKLPEGAFRRIGPTDQSCTEDDMVVFFGDRQSNSYDKTPLLDATLDDIDVYAIEYYRKLKQNVRPNTDDLAWNDQDLLEALTAIKKINGVWYPTVNGIMLFGTKQAQRRLFPMTRVDYIRVPGTEWVENPDERYYTVDMRGPLLSIAKRIQDTISDDLPSGFFLPEGNMQAQNYVLSTRVLREAIVNALMHRTYKVHGAIQVIRYSNRLEIINPGYSLKAEEKLGEPGSNNRNPHLAAVFYETNLAENKGSGIKAMQNLLKAAQFAPPTFESDRVADTFTVRVLLQHLLTPKDLKWLLNFSDFKLNSEQKKSLLFLREVGALDNRTYRQFNSVDNITATKDLRLMKEQELLEMKGQGFKSHYKAGPAYIMVTQQQVQNDELVVRTPHPLSIGEGNLPLADLPEGVTIDEELISKIVVVRNSGYSRSDFIRNVIYELCEKAPLSAAQLSRILNRKIPNLREKHLTPLIRMGVLCYTIPENQFNSKQAYTVC